MFGLGYNEALEIVPAVEKVLDEIDQLLAQFAQDTNAYNATMQDAVAVEATEIIVNLCGEVNDLREMIKEANQRAGVGIGGFKKIEDDAERGLE